MLEAVGRSPTYVVPRAAASPIAMPRLCGCLPNPQDLHVLDLLHGSTEELAGLVTVAMANERGRLGTTAGAHMGGQGWDGVAGVATRDWTCNTLYYEFV